MLDSNEELYKWFTQQVMLNLHIVFTMNPSGDGLKDKCSTSPALFNRFVCFLFVCLFVCLSTSVCLYLYFSIFVDLFMLVLIFVLNLFYHYFLPRCVLNWFGDWSNGALYSVGQEFTIKIDLDKMNVRAHVISRVTQCHVTYVTLVTRLA